MRSVLFFPDMSENVNKRVQTKIAKHLFIFCNYNPDSLKVFGEDSKFLVASLNSYKLLIDCSVMKHLKQAAKQCSIKYDFISYDTIISTVSNIRTNLGHNMNDLNGDEDSILQFRNWLQKATGKHVIQNGDDYSKALFELDRLTQEAIRIINEFIDNVSVSPNKTKFIKKWEEGIVRYYCKGNHDIIRNQLRLSYKSVSYSDVRLSGSRFNTETRPIDVAIWVKTRMLYTPESRKALIEDTIQEFGIKLGAEKISQLQKKKKEYENEIRSIKEDVANFHGCRISELSNAFKYYEYYVNTFEERICKYLPTIISSKQTMFPQDMIQWIIDAELMQS